jgi:hypothetical protein
MRGKTIVVIFPSSGKRERGGGRERERERERRERGEKEIERVCMMELCCIRQAGRTGNLPSLEPLRVPQT